MISMRRTKFRARQDKGWVGLGDYGSMYPHSTKTREVLGNPSPMPKRFPETRGKSRGSREISRAEGNIEGRGDRFPNNSRVLVEYRHSLIINIYARSGSENPFLADDERMINNTMFKGNQDSMLSSCKSKVTMIPSLPKN